MQDLDTDEVSIHVAAAPEAVYAVVADVTRTPELSPEIISCRWMDGAEEAEAGARFEATNKVQRGPSWKNHPVVTVAEPGREFAFSRTEWTAGTVVWRYRFAPEGDGTRVTESYEVTRPIPRFGWFIMERLFGCRDRRGDLRAGMEETLERLREVVEAERPSQLL